MDFLPMYSSSFGNIQILTHVLIGRKFVYSAITVKFTATLAFRLPESLDCRNVRIFCHSIRLQILPLQPDIYTKPD
jgi:hypothetical protein